ncbi:EAL domain-containing protein [Viridibacillus arvi]|uniref:EAL domain-containing protein n=1 Tax=Viridibacillus arvi TaxID=263475 RepID=UPI003694EB11
MQDLAEKHQTGLHKIKTDEAAVRQYQLERDLQQAVSNKEIYTVFQPIVHKNGSIGFEALARWKSPIHGHVGPNEFIPIAEKSLLIEKITETIIQDTVSIINKHKNITYVTVNLSANVIENDEWLLNVLDDIIDVTPFERKALVFEITEGLTLTQKHWDSIKTIRSLKHPILIDDFGTGQTSMSHLLNESVDGVKLDQMFISDLSSEKNQKLITLTIDLFKVLDLLVVIEGVEFQDQNQFIQTIDYDAIQGYLESAPIAASSINTYLDLKFNKTS